MVLISELHFHVADDEVTGRDTVCCRGGVARPGGVDAADGDPVLVLAGDAVLPLSESWRPAAAAAAYAMGTIAGFAGRGISTGYASEHTSEHK